MTTSPMTLRRTLARRLGHNLAVVALLACGVVIAEANTETVRAGSPDVTECFNSSTGQIFTIATGETCP